MLVGRQSIFFVALEEGVDSAGGLTDLLELTSQSFRGSFTSSSACDCAIANSSITSARFCRSAGQSGRDWPNRATRPLAPCCADDRAGSRHVADDRFVLS